MHDKEYMARLRKKLRQNKVSLQVLPVFEFHAYGTIVHTIGMVETFKGKDCELPQPKPLQAGDPTADWQPIEEVAMKKRQAAQGIDKIMVFLGAKKGFRSKDMKTLRFKKGVDRGFCRGYKPSVVADGTAEEKKEEEEGDKVPEPEAVDDLDI